MATARSKIRVGLPPLMATTKWPSNDTWMRAGRPCLGRAPTEHRARIPTTLRVSSEVLAPSSCKPSELLKEFDYGDLVLLTQPTPAAEHLARVTAILL